MTAPKLTFDQWVRTRVRGHCYSRIAWDKKKKQHAKEVDVKAFKLNLGATLDSLDAACDWAKLVKKNNGKIDPQTVKRVRGLEQKAKQTLHSYIQICGSGKVSKQQTAKQQQAWKELQEALDQIERQVPADARNALA